MSNVHPTYIDSESNTSHKITTKQMTGLGYRHVPEKGLHIYNCFGVCHVVFLSTHSALFVHNHHVGSKGDTTPEQII